jgi:acyl dehydratase
VWPITCPERSLTIRDFSEADQMAFAGLSGDYNPLHMDATAARRLVFGQPVVHGIHSALRALDCWCRGLTGAVILRTLRVDFRRPIRLGEQVRYAFKEERDCHGTITLTAGNAVVTAIRLEWSTVAETSTLDLVSSGSPPRGDCRDWSGQLIGEAHGTLDLWWDAAAASRLFPGLTLVLPVLQIAEILATTRLVGMECPGLHSVLSQVSLTFEEIAKDDLRNPTLRYSAAMLDPRFNLLVLDVLAPGMTGTVKAFIRPPPREQIRYLDTRHLVEPSEFANKRILVVGGSRGLGEVTAKLLAAGGADVRITYHRGAADAHRIVEEIRAGHGLADSLRLDVLDLDPEWQSEFSGGWWPTDLYYFATPFISPGKKSAFSVERFDDFCRYYVGGFAELFQGLSRRGLQRAFYPSSVYVDAPPENMGEYAAAKAAGEALCAFLERSHPGVKLHRPRLPRIATDQTASLLPVDQNDAPPIILEHVRKMNDHPVRISQ